MRRTVLCIMLLGMLTTMGCATVPFEAHERVSMKGKDPSGVVKAYSDALPERLNLLSSIMFRYNFISKMTVLGTIEADMASREFSVVGISPLGVKIFEVEAGREGIKNKYVIPPMAEKGDLATTVARDIERIYYDLIPSAHAEVRVKRNCIEFEEPHGEGRMVYVFAGPEANLVMKKYFDHGMLRWKVGYYEYRKKGGRLYPGGVVLTDRKWGYTLTARIRKIYDGED